MVPHDRSVGASCGPTTSSHVGLTLVPSCVPTRPSRRQKSTPAGRALATRTCEPVTSMVATVVVHARSRQICNSAPSVVGSWAQRRVGLCDVTLEVDSGPTGRGAGIGMQVAPTGT